MLWFAMAIKYAFILISFFLFAGAASSQSQEKPKTQPQEQTQKTEKPAEKLKKGAPQDLDAFFKEGAEQAKEGPSCRKPSVPVA